MNTLLLPPAICLVPVELEVRRQLSAEGAEPLQHDFRSGLFAHSERPRITDEDFDVIAFPQFQRLDYVRRQANRQAIAPLCDLHGYTQMIYT
ncbi:hypothetical protein NUG21_19080 [Xanthomonas sp. CFBP 8445]|nr:hypothetical protein [Xanthomonas sp. CFBP 8445]UYC11825.1 hypothetical protein NUG21_19080 [Xanthomonas sp. CFBP 8445]